MQTKNTVAQAADFLVRREEARQVQDCRFLFALCAQASRQSNLHVRGIREPLRREPVMFQCHFRKTAPFIAVGKIEPHL